jgi:adenylate cyclase
VEVLALVGRPEEALRAVEKAMRLNPHYPPFYLFFLGWTYDLTGRHAEAVATLKEVISRSPDYLAAHFNLAFSYVTQWAAQQSADAQTLEQALEAAQRGIALSDSLHWSHMSLGFVYLWQK